MGRKKQRNQGKKCTGLEELKKEEAKEQTTMNQRLNSHRFLDQTISSPAKCEISPMKSVAPVGLHSKSRRYCNVDCLPNEILEKILLNAVVEELMERWAKVSWDKQATEVINRLGVVSSRWSEVLKGKHFQILLQRELQSQDIKPISLVTIDEKQFEGSVHAVATRYPYIYVVTEVESHATSIDCLWEYHLNIFEYRKSDCCMHLLQTLRLDGVDIVYNFLALQHRLFLVTDKDQVLWTIPLSTLKLTKAMTFEKDIGIVSMAEGSLGRLLILTERQRRNQNELSRYQLLVCCARQPKRNQLRVTLPSEVTNPLWIEQNQSGNVIIFQGYHQKTICEWNISENKLVKILQINEEISRERFRVDRFGRILTMNAQHTELVLFDAEFNRYFKASMPKHIVNDISESDALNFAFGDYKNQSVVLFHSGAVYVFGIVD